MLIWTLRANYVYLRDTRRRQLNLYSMNGFKLEKVDRNKGRSSATALMQITHYIIFLDALCLDINVHITFLNGTRHRLISDVYLSYLIMYLLIDWLHDNSWSRVTSRATVFTVYTVRKFIVNQLTVVVVFFAVFYS